MRAKLSLAIASVLVSAIAATAPADAACKKFGFTVNDYGKEGPTNDAKNLLDKHITEWAAQNGVTAYQTGKKSVSCELFLDVILFDEHTCTASASVCWGDGVKPNNKGAEQAGNKGAAAEQAEVIGDAGDGAMPPAPVSKAVALGIPPQPQTAAATAPTEAAAAPTAPVEQIAAPAEAPAATPAVHTPPATPAMTGGVETGALQVGQGAAAVQNIAPPLAPPAPNQDRAAAASAAAAAAAAAERAAMAAETAANAAKEAAAAAVAASAASRGPATVPPLDHASGAAPAHNE